VTRKIIHIDMDAFYAAVEQRDNPELRGKPVVVGGDPGRRGVVATASYEARKYGIRSAMSSARALRQCPHAVFVRPNMTRYRQVSTQIRAVFYSITPLVEPVSLDEAYLDVTENELNMSLAQDVARYIKDQIRHNTGLTASAGVAPCKFIAKVASDMRKPDGLTVVAPERVDVFLETLPVNKIWGVGPVTARKLQELGLNTVGDVRRYDKEALERRLGSYGPFLHGLAHGIDPRPVTPNREPKSRGAECTFDQDIVDVHVLEQVVEKHALNVAQALTKLGRKGRSITLKIRYGDFKTITRSATVSPSTDSARVICETATELLHTGTLAGKRPIRLLGVSVGSFDSLDGPEQLWLNLPLP